MHPARHSTGHDLPPMIIDSFAGGGGASSGIENALGRSPDVAINHNAAVREGHSDVGSLVLHLLEAAEDARAALRALAGSSDGEGGV